MTSIPRLFFFLLLASIWLVPMRGWAITSDEEEALLLDQKKKAEHQDDTNAAAQIDAQIAQLKNEEAEKNAPPNDILADPEHGLYTLLPKGSIVKPASLPPELAELVPASPHAAWQQASFEHVAEHLQDKIALLHPHLGHADNSRLPCWVISEKEVKDVTSPEDPNTAPRLGIYVFGNGQPVGGLVLFTKGQ